MLERVDAFRQVAERAGLNASISENIHVDVWSKFVMMATFSAITSLTWLPVRTIISADSNRSEFWELGTERPAAITDYRHALRYAPTYEPSRRALSRLTGSASTRVPTGAAERDAAALAERAAELARRGAYAEAMELLDRALHIAPAAVVVYQHRANVAFLMGDYAEAENALSRALELEPDNALFARNLIEVQARMATTEQ